MRAAIQQVPGGPVSVEEFPEPPAPGDGEVMIEVATAGLGGWDVIGQYREAIDYPCVVRGEGVGHLSDGRRVYFGERSVMPYGAWGERTVVPESEVWDVPDGVSDRLAITMAIAGTGAIVPLEEAKIAPGESVLITGATGALGQVALQLARRLGAERVVAAGRNEAALDRIAERGIADATVRTGNGVEADAEALHAASGEGFDVVLDIVYGEPFVAALKATRFGARVMTIGVQAGITANVFAADLLYRTHTVVGTGQLPPADRRVIWERLLQTALEHDIDVDYREFALADAGEAYELQRSGPHAKVVATIA